MEFLYCDKFVDCITPLQMKATAEVSRILGLTNLSGLFKKKAEFARSKLFSNLVKDFQHELNNPPANEAGIVMANPNPNAPITSA